MKRRARRTLDRRSCMYGGDNAVGGAASATDARTFGLSVLASAAELDHGTNASMATGRAFDWAAGVWQDAPRVLAGAAAGGATAQASAVTGGATGSAVRSGVHVGAGMSSQDMRSYAATLATMSTQPADDDPETRVGPYKEYPRGTDPLSLTAQHKAELHLQLHIDLEFDDKCPKIAADAKGFLDALLKSIASYLDADGRIFVNEGDHGEHKLAWSALNPGTSLQIPLVIESGLVIKSNPNNAWADPWMFMPNSLVPAPMLAMALQHALMSWHQFKALSKLRQEKYGVSIEDPEDNDQTPNAGFVHKWARKYFQSEVRMMDVAVSSKTQALALSYTETAFVVQFLAGHVFTEKEWREGVSDPVNADVSGTQMTDVGQQQSKIKANFYRQSHKIAVIIAQINAINPSTFWMVRRYVENAELWDLRHKHEAKCSATQSIWEWVGALDIKTPLLYVSGNKTLTQTIRGFEDKQMDTYHYNAVRNLYTNAMGELRGAFVEDQDKDILSKIQDMYKTSHVPVHACSVYTFVRQWLFNKFSDNVTKFAELMDKSLAPGAGASFFRLQEQNNRSVIVQDYICLRASEVAWACHQMVTMPFVTIDKVPTDGRMGPYWYWLLPLKVDLTGLADSAPFACRRFHNQVCRFYWSNEMFDASAYLKGLSKARGWVQRMSNNAFVPSKPPKDTSVPLSQKEKDQIARTKKTCIQLQANLCEILSVDNRGQPVRIYSRVMCPTWHHSTFAKYHVPWSDKFWNNAEPYLALSIERELFQLARPDLEAVHGVGAQGSFMPAGSVESMCMDTSMDMETSMQPHDHEGNAMQFMFTAGKPAAELTMTEQKQICCTLVFWHIFSPLACIQRILMIFSQYLDPNLLAFFE